MRTKSYGQVTGDFELLANGTEPDAAAREAADAAERD
jgi:hypothetical protein